MPIRIFLIGLAYYACAWFSVHKTVTPEGIAIIWLPNAVVLAAFLLSPGRQWAMIASVVLVAELLADWPHFPLWACLVFGIINITESAVAAGLIRRYVPDRFDFSRLAHGIYFLLFGPLLAAAVAALAGAAVYLILGRADTSYLALWRLWWLGDALGLLLLTPLIIMGVRSQWGKLNSTLTKGTVFEAVILGSLVVIVGLQVFMPVEPFATGFRLTPILLMPLAIWSAIRFHVTGATLTVTAIAILAVTHLTLGLSPYPQVSPQHTVWLVQEYLIILAIMSYGLALLIQELLDQRRLLLKQKGALRTQNRRLSRRVAERTQELEQANQQLQQLASTDHLTQLLNRRVFEELASRELQRRKHAGLSLVLLIFDIDNFKRINDEYGHEMGDEVLRQIATPVSRCIRPLDLCARTGGEEFSVLLPDLSESEALQVAERIRTTLSGLVVSRRDYLISITVSVGLAVWNGHDDLEELMHQADTALYQAKRQGRNQVAVYS